MADVDDELRRVREQMTLLSQAPFEGLFWHVDGFILGANERFSELTGYPPSEIHGSEVFKALLAPEDVPRVFERMAARYEGTYVVTCVCKDGSRFRAELQAKQGKWGERPVRVVAVRDVTERERMEALIRESETRLRLLAAASFDVIAYSRNGVIVDITGAFERLYGRTREQLVGHRVLRRIRAQGSRVPVLFTSGYHDASLDSDATGFQAFLAKPYTLAELYAAVERALGARSQ